MTTVKDLGVTEANIRDYVLNGNGDALTQDQLNGICYDYLNKVMRQVERKWPKDLRAELSRYGIRQHHETKLPVITESAISLKTSCQDSVARMQTLLAELTTVVEDNDIITLVDGLPLKDKSEEEREADRLEIDELLKNVSFMQASKNRCDDYIDKLLKIMAENNVAAPSFLQQ